MSSQSITPKRVRDTHPVIWLWKILLDILGIELTVASSLVLKRQDGHGVGIEEMDSLQMEIESMLVNAMQRNRLLKIETMILDSEKPESLTVSSQSDPKR